MTTSIVHFFSLRVSDVQAIRPTLAVMAALLAPVIALAHGIFDADKQRMLDGGYLQYVGLGATHMLTGYDHLLLLFGVVFFLTTLRDIAKFVTAFTVGYCVRSAHPTGRPARRPPRRASHLVTHPHCRTSVANLYAAGDVVSALDQVSVAVGHAAVAATTVHNTLLTDSA